MELTKLNKLDWQNIKERTSPQINKQKGSTREHKQRLARIIHKLCTEADRTEHYLEKVRQALAGIEMAIELGVDLDSE